LSFTGAGSAPSAGILVAGGPAYNQPYTVGAVITGNEITASDIGIVVFEAEVNLRPAAVPTQTRIEANVIRNNALNNLYGSGQKGYQAGIKVRGNGDAIIGNAISGRGYDKSFCGGAAVCTPIDVKHTIDPTVSGNVIR